MFGCSFRAKSFESGSYVKPSNPCREAAFSVTLDTCSAAWGCDNARGRPDTLFWPQFQTHSRRIFVPTRRGNSEFMYAKVNGIAHFTWPRQLWMEQKLFVDFYFLDSNIASCMGVVKIQNTCILTVLGTTAWPCCECIQAKMQIQGKTKLQGRNDLRRLPTSFGSCNQAGRKNAKSIPMSSQKHVSYLCVALLSIWERTWSRILCILFAFFSAGEAMEKLQFVWNDCECLIPACGGLKTSHLFWAKTIGPGSSFLWWNRPPSAFLKGTVPETELMTPLNGEELTCFQLVNRHLNRIRYIILYSYYIHMFKHQRHFTRLSYGDSEFRADWAA